MSLIRFLPFQFDYEDASSYLVFGGGGAVALWLAAAIVGAIDSIPLVSTVYATPKLNIRKHGEQTFPTFNLF